MVSRPKLLAAAIISPGEYPHSRRGRDNWQAFALFWSFVILLGNCSFVIRGSYFGQMINYSERHQLKESRT
jgi:hypothetical protein